MKTVYDPYLLVFIVKNEIFENCDYYALIENLHFGVHSRKIV